MAVVKATIGPVTVLLRGWQQVTDSGNMKWVKIGSKNGVAMLTINTDKLLHHARKALAAKSLKTTLADGAIVINIDPNTITTITEIGP